MKAGKDLIGIGICLKCDEVTRITKDLRQVVKDNKQFCILCGCEEFKFFWPDPEFPAFPWDSDEEFLKEMKIGGDDGRRCGHEASIQTTRREGNPLTQ